MERERDEGRETKELSETDHKHMTNRNKVTILCLKIIPKRLPMAHTVYAAAAPHRTYRVKKRTKMKQKSKPHVNQWQQTNKSKPLY